MIIYSTDIDIPRISNNSHEKHRNITKYVEKYFNNWKLIEILENPFKPKHFYDDQGSEANFYIYEKLDL